jgi:hypothetical protein
MRHHVHVPRTGFLKRRQYIVRVSLRGFLGGASALTGHRQGTPLVRIDAAHSWAHCAASFEFGVPGLSLQKPRISQGRPLLSLRLASPGAPLHRHLTAITPCTAAALATRRARRDPAPPLLCLRCVWTRRGRAVCCRASTVPSHASGTVMGDVFICTVPCGSSVTPPRRAHRDSPPPRLFLHSAWARYGRVLFAAGRVLVLPRRQVSRRCHLH